MPDDRFLHRRAGHSAKVNMLTDLEYRVWTQYLLSADDFGVMRFSPITLQADNDHLANRPSKMLQRCLDALVKPNGLLRTFDHQNRRYVYQHDWQAWQKVSYPRTTTNPPPPDDALDACDEVTRKLFLLHPGGAGRKRGELSPRVPETVQNGSENISETVQECSPLMRAGAPAKRLTANGIRLTANGSDGEIQQRWGARAVRELPVAPYDEWFTAFRDAYHPKGRVDNPIVRDAFMGVFTRSQASPADIFADLLAAVQNHAAGDQWARGMVPAMLKWLDDGYYLQRHDPPASAPVAKKPWAPLRAS